MLINKTTLDFLFQQWDQLYASAYEAQPEMWPKYATMVPSSTLINVHSWLARQTGLKRWVGARQVDNVVARDYSLKNLDWEKTIGLDRNKILDDTYGVFGMAISDMGTQGKLWPDDVMTPIVEGGDSALCYDGQYFYDTDHPVDMDDSTKGTFSNLLLGANYDLSAGDPIGVWRRVRAAGAKFLGEDLRPLGVTFDTLMVPPDLEAYAIMVANQQLTAQALGSVAVAGVSNIWQGSVNVVMNPRLTGTGRAYALCTNRGVKPFIWQVRQSPVLIARNAPTDPSVFDAKEFKYGVDARGAGGYAHPWLSICFGAA